MQIHLTQIADGVSPSLARLLENADNRQTIHEAIGLALISLARKAFTQSDLRPSAWPALHGGGTATLYKTGTLAKSPRVISVSGSGVSVGSDRRYAAIHQLGGKTKAHVIRGKKGQEIGQHPGSKIPARPYFPFLPDGLPTPAGHTAILQAIETKLAEKKMA